MDQESIDLLAHDLVDNGLMIVDTGFKPQVPTDVVAIPVPITDIAREAGSALYKGMVALGASAALLGLPLEGFKQYVSEKFSRKGDDVLQANFTALERGFAGALEAAGGRGFHMDSGDGKRRMLMTGNDAVALGAVMAGCRVAAAYPITPASEILENLARILPKYGGVAVQMEDELASVSLVIGAGFAGARALTSTSGPGLSLKQELLGVASIAEVPVVLVDCQRGGPSTGMPTKQEQSDLLAMCHGGHGEGPRIVLAPGNAEQAFYDTVLAFNLADNYHCPVIIATDLAMGLWQQTIDELEYERIHQDRGPIIDVEALKKLGGAEFARYKQNPNLVSPRSLPGMPGGQYLATGAEHHETGKVSESPANRTRMMDRRLGKLRGGLKLDGQPVNGVEYHGAENPDVLLISFGTTFGAVAESAEHLTRSGLSVATAQVRVLRPLPVDELNATMSRAKRIFVVEHNALGQLAFLMRAEGVRRAGEATSILKYDGTLFLAQEIADRVRSALQPKEVRV